MIEVIELEKSYGQRAVLQGVSFTCTAGRVTGFLGPNGAGKSTTLRILCGLSTADRGRALIDGATFASHRAVATTIGVMLDTSALHPGRTGRETCRLAAMMAGQSRDRADELLVRVGLDRAARKYVGAYSLGMRQRLGIAVALVGAPRTLVLDEPVNGLDPEGIHWIRTLIRDFAADGGTVLVSSHLLNEVAATVDDVVIINQGRIVRQGSLAELTVADHGVVLEVLDPQRLVTALRRRQWPFEPAGAGLLVRAGAEQVGRLLIEEQIVPVRMAPLAQSNIEEVFLHLTGAPADHEGVLV